MAAALPRALLNGWVLKTDRLVSYARVTGGARRPPNANPGRVKPRLMKGGIKVMNVKKE